MTYPPRQPAAACPAPTRPALHFTPAEGWMNDPNGLVYFDGEYHLFYQYHPHGRVWGPMHWGHAVSRDLCRWEHLPVALTPDEAGMCFSGSAIVDRHDTSGLFDGEPGLLAFYTVHRMLPEDPDCPGQEQYVQEQCLAYSRDRGRSWQKYAGNPILSNPDIRDFRDPKVIWHAPSRRWVMALACGQSVQFHVSDNLLDWRLASEFGAVQGRHTDGPWECPDLFELPIDGRDEKRWVLVVGVGAGEQDDFGSFTQYFVGHFDGERFHNENPASRVLLMDEGRDFYAVQSWSDIPVADGRRLAIAWLNNWLYANRIPEAGWRGAMSFPRELTLTATPEGGRLRQAFARELEGAGGEVATGFSLPLDLDEGDHRLVETGHGGTHGRLRLVLEPGARVELDLQQGGQQWLCVTRDDDGMHVEHHRRGRNGVAAFDAHYPHERLVYHLAGDSLALEWLADQGSLEVLLDGGRVALTHLSFADPVAWPLVLRVRQGRCRLMVVVVHPLTAPAVMPETM